MKILKRDFLPDDFSTELVRAGFHGSIAVQARQSMEETQWLLELASAHPFIKGVVGWVDLRSPDIERQLTKVSLNSKFVGVRHIVQDEPDDNFMLRPDFMKGIEVLQTLDLTYDILVYPKQLHTAVHLAARFPDMRFVLDHIAKPLIKNKIISPWKEDIKELAQCPNVFCKLSGMVTEADWAGWKHDDFLPYLDVVFEEFTPGRLMIGSDWPVCTLAGNYENVLGIVLKSIKNFSQEEQAMVLGENAITVYKLKVSNYSPR
jgi:L-fuconolactonase